MGIEAELVVVVGDRHEWAVSDGFGRDAPVAGERGCDAAEQGPHREVTLVRVGEVSKVERVGEFRRGEI